MGKRAIAHLPLMCVLEKNQAVNQVVRFWVELKMLNVGSNHNCVLNE